MWAKFNVVLHEYLLVDMLFIAISGVECGVRSHSNLITKRSATIMAIVA